MQSRTYRSNSLVEGSSILNREWSRHQVLVHGGGKLRLRFSIRSITPDLSLSALAYGASATVRPEDRAAVLLLQMPRVGTGADPPDAFATSPNEQTMNSPATVAPFRIGMLIHPGMTSLDFVGPLDVFARLPNTKVHVLAKHLALVVTDIGMHELPTLRMADAPPLDLLFIGGGPGVNALMEGQEPIDFLVQRAPQHHHAHPRRGSEQLLGRARYRGQAGRRRHGMHKELAFVPTRAAAHPKVIRTCWTSTTRKPV